MLNTSSTTTSGSLTYLDWPFCSLSYWRCQRVRMNLNSYANASDKRRQQNEIPLHHFHGHICFFERPKKAFIGTIHKLCYQKRQNDYSPKGAVYKPRGQMRGKE